MLKIAHIVNPVNVKQGSELSVAQPITFATMRQAQAAAAGQVVVSLFAVGYPEDDPAMPHGFTVLPYLTRSVLDVGRFTPSRKLPLLSDILDSLDAASDADYFVYTNVDIALQPRFYTAVSNHINSGLDAFVINRRTISKTHTTVAAIPQMQQEGGEAHRGWDCFIFSRAVYSQYVLGEICIGAPRMGLALLANLVAHAQQFREFKEEHLTFHLGDDQSWRSWQPSDYERHNTREAMQVLALLEAKNGRFPRHTPPGSFLFKKRTLGPLYELWTRTARLPIGWSQWLNSKLSSKED